MIKPFVGELIGTALLILLGDGVVAAVLLNKSKAHNAGWIVIAWGWAVAVFVGVFASAAFSGGHLNPAVTVSFALIGKLPQEQVPAYLGGQFLGAFLGAVLVWLAYLPHWEVSTDADAKLGVFCTAPAIRRPAANCLTEVIATFVLILGGLLIVAPNLEQASAESLEPTLSLKIGAFGGIPVALVVLGIGLSLGGPTGYAINPARDFGPRLAHALLPIPGKRDADWGYAWVPILGPLVGGALAAFLYQYLESLK